MYRRLHVLISKTEEQAMSQYRTFTAQDAVEYAVQFGGLDDPSSLVEAQEVGDGNLNLVLKFSTARASAASSLSRRCPTYAASANPRR